MKRCYSCFLAVLALLMVPVALVAQASGPGARPQPPSPVPVATLASPNDQIAMSFAIQPASLTENGSGKLVYSVAFRGKPVIDNSALGLELDRNTPLGANVTVAGTQPGSGVE